MKKISFLLILAYIIASCAKRGTITGGFKDTLAPVIVKSLPKNYNTNFTGKKIIINFNEFIKVKDISKQLIVSPPMNVEPTVIPQGAASKFISITLNDTLKQNTTYSFNFGQSIVDNNEENPYSQFKYVFSTGSVIDSLSIEGEVKDAFEGKNDDYISVMLYDAKTFKDSIVYKENPLYATNTLQGNNKFKFENLKEGNYQLIAIKEKTSNYKYNAKTEKIAFLNQTINVPKDNNLLLKLFNEIPNFKPQRPTQESNNKYYMGFEGQPKNLKISTQLKQDKVALKWSNLNGKKSDSIQFFLPSGIKDSIKVKVEADGFQKEFNLKILKQKVTDSLRIRQKTLENLLYSETFTLQTSTPIVKTLKEKITLKNKAGKLVKFDLIQNEIEQEIAFNFVKEENEKYKISCLPGAFEDYFGTKSDSINYTFEQPSENNFGNLKILLKNAKKLPVIVEILDSTNKIIQSIYSNKETVFNFEGIKPSLYTLRVFYDDNNNKTWDTGSFLKKIQPEEIIYFPQKLDVRANWDVEQEFELK